MDGVAVVLSMDPSEEQSTNERALRSGVKYDPKLVAKFTAINLANEISPIFAEFFADDPLSKLKGVLETLDQKSDLRPLVKALVDEIATVELPNPADRDMTPEVIRLCSQIQT